MTARDLRSDALAGLGHLQLQRLIEIASPATAAVSADDVTLSLMRRGLAEPLVVDGVSVKRGGYVATPDGFRAIADAMEAGRIQLGLVAMTAREAQARRRKARERAKIIGGRG